LLALSATPLAIFLILVAVLGASCWGTRRLGRDADAAGYAWRFGMTTGLVIGVIHLLALLAYFILTSTAGSRLTPFLWLFPTTLGSLIVAGTLRVVLFAGLGAVAGWLATRRQESADERDA
jgi:hypothetical protein